MTTIDLMDLNVRAAIAFSLTLIAAMLTLITLKLYDDHKKPLHRKARRRDATA